jgi:phage tail sheath protein FI
MPMCHTPYVSVEEVDSARQAGPGLCPRVTRTALQAWCATELQWVAHEPHNAPSLWGQVSRHVRGYLGVLWVSGALRGEKPREAFVVKCDQTTMTQADIRDGKLICEIGVAPVTPSKFGLYRILIRLKPFQRSLATIY